MGGSRSLSDALSPSIESRGGFGEGAVVGSAKKALISSCIGSSPAAATQFIDGVNHGCRDATALELYRIVARGVGRDWYV